MNEKTNSLIRHILTALSTVLMLVGVSHYTGILQYLIDNLNDVGAAITTLITVGTTIYGFFFKKEERTIIAKK